MSEDTAELELAGYSQAHPEDKTPYPTRNRDNGRKNDRLERKLERVWNTLQVVMRDMVIQGLVTELLVFLTDDSAEVPHALYDALERDDLYCSKLMDEICRVIDNTQGAEGVEKKKAAVREGIRRLRLTAPRYKMANKL